MLTEVFIQRNISLTALTCQFTREASSSIMTLAMVIVVLLLSAVALGIMLRLQWFAITKSRVSPADVGVSQQENAEVAKRAKKITRLILMTCGLQVVTSVQAVLVRVLVLGRLTWADVETRRSLGASLLVRWSLYLNAHLPAVLDPLVYFYTHPELREAGGRLWRRQRVDAS